MLSNMPALDSLHYFFASMTLLVGGSYYFIAQNFNKYKKKQEEQYKQRDEFTAMMVHDLRSPLSVIKSSADLILTEKDNLSAEQISDLLNQMKASSARLLDIVTNLLDIAKIEAGKIELFMKPVDLNALLDETYKYYFPQAKDRGVNIIEDLDQNVKPVNCDIEKIRQVITNLMSNAVKYTEPGDTIFIVSRLQKDCVEISVADTGKGISNEDKAKLFNKYVQAVEHKQKNRAGTGLGLSIVKGIVEAHKGRIWIEDNQPHGAKFIVALPA